MAFSTDKAKMESLEQVIKPENIFPYTQRLVTIVFDFKMFWNVSLFISVDLEQFELFLLKWSTC